jgi:hypothetical protein
MRSRWVWRDLGWLALGLALVSGPLDQAGSRRPFASPKSRFSMTVDERIIAIARFTKHAAARTGSPAWPISSLLMMLRRAGLRVCSPVGVHQAPSLSIGNPDNPY